MTWLTRFALFAGLFAGSAAFAQTTTGTTGGTTTGTQTSGNSNTGGSSSNLGNNSGFTGTQLETATQITGSNVSQGQVNGTNAFAATYANPMYAGRAGTDGKGDPGGFGIPLASGGGAGGRTTGSAANFGTNNRATNANRSATGTNIGTTGRTTGSTTGTNRAATGMNTTTGTQPGLGFGSGFGGTTTGGRTTGSFGNTQMNSMMGGRNSGLGGNSMFGGSQQQGIVAQQPVPIASSVQVKFPVRQITTPQMHADLNAALGRSTYLSNPRGISVQYDNKIVVLRGAVKDEEEARTAEGIVRLTPGVRSVKNELTYPAAAPQP